MTRRHAGNSAAITTNPIWGWMDSFSRNFQFSWLWLWVVLQSGAALVWVLGSKAPRRILRLLEHLTSGLLGLLKWLNTVDGDLASWFKGGLYAFAAWTGRLIAKIIDLFGIGELVDLTGTLLKVNTRSLTEEEVQEAKLVFGDSLPYWRVRIDEWSLIAHVGKWFAERRLKQPVGEMAVTVFGTINFSRRINPKRGNSDMAWLIHELTHVAQNEHVGSQFMGEALYAQNTAGYDYGGVEKLHGRDLHRFNREQQGDIARDYYKCLYAKEENEKEKRSAFHQAIDQLRMGRI